MSDQVLSDGRLADCSKMLYIYIYIYTHTQNSIFGRSEKDRFLDGFWKSFWNGFGEVFGEVLERFWRGILDAPSIKIVVFYIVF